MVYNTNDDAIAGLKAKQIDGLVVDLPTAFYVTAAQVENSVIVGQFAAADRRRRRALQRRAGQGQPADRLRQRRDRGAEERRHARRDHARSGWPTRPAPRSSSRSPRRPRRGLRVSLSGGPLDTGELIVSPAGAGLVVRRRRVPPGEALRSTLIALVSTVVVFGLIVVVVTNAPNWPAVQQRVLRRRDLRPVVAEGRRRVRHERRAVPDRRGADPRRSGWCWRSSAACRARSSSRSGSSRPIYVDFFRAVPGLLVIYLLGFGIPGLGIAGVPNDLFL